MKNFSGFNAYQKVGVKNAVGGTSLRSGVSNSYIKNTSNKNPTNYNSSNVKKNTQKSSRNGSIIRQRYSRSIEQRHQANHFDQQLQDINNEYSRSPIPAKQNENDSIFVENGEQMFHSKKIFYEESERKIKNLKTNFNMKGKNSEIEIELQQILSIIKEERKIMTAKIQELQAKNKDIEKIKKQQKMLKEEIGVNTTQMIVPLDERIYNNVSIQTYEQPQTVETQKISQEEEKQKKQQNQVQPQIYQKLSNMLLDMNIYHKDILPNEIEIRNFHDNEGMQQKKWKTLSDQEIIKIQKFFIKKLAEQLSSKEMNKK